MRNFLAGIAPQSKTVLVAVIAFILAVDLITLPSYSSRAQDRQTPADRQAVAEFYRVAGTIPSDAAVCAQGGLTPHFALRNRMYRLWNASDTIDYNHADYIVLCTAANREAFATEEEFDQAVNAARSNPAFEKIHDAGGVVVLKRKDKESK